MISTMWMWAVVLYTEALKTVPKTVVMLALLFSSLQMCTANEGGTLGQRWKRGWG